jgi:hypothetical protein
MTPLIDGHHGTKQREQRSIVIFVFLFTIVKQHKHAWIDPLARMPTLFEIVLSLTFLSATACLLLVRLIDMTCLHVRNKRAIHDPLEISWISRCYKKGTLILGDLLCWIPLPPSSLSAFVCVLHTAPILPSPLKKKMISPQHVPQPPASRCS